MFKKNVKFFVLVLFVLIGILAVIYYISFFGFSEPSPCLNTLDKEMTEFKIQLEVTAILRDSNRFEFAPNLSCFSNKGASLRIKVEKDENICATKCNYPTDVCFLLDFSSPVEYASRIKCLNLPRYTSFLTENCFDSNDTSLVGYAPINPLNSNLQVGSYILKNISSPNEAYPKVCILYKN